MGESPSVWLLAEHAEARRVDVDDVRPLRRSDLGGGL